MQLFIFLAGIVLLLYLIRYLLFKIFNKGADAINNAYKRHKNAQEDGNTGNLSDRYLK